MTKYESAILAVDTEAGYQALHEDVQDGWEPIYHWTDRHGTHMVLRREVVDGFVFTSGRVDDSITLAEKEPTHCAVHTYNRLPCETCDTGMRSASPVDDTATR